MIWKICYGATFYFHKCKNVYNTRFCHHRRLNYIINFSSPSCYTTHIFPNRKSCLIGFIVNKIPRIGF